MKLDPRVRTGIASTDFPHIRKADLTLDRPVGITDRHGSRVEVKVEVTPAN
jgi:hypothetical protein